MSKQVSLANLIIYCFLQLEPSMIDKAFSLAHRWHNKHNENNLPYLGNRREPDNFSSAPQVVRNEITEFLSTQVIILTC